MKLLAPIDETSPAPYAGHAVAQRHHGSTNCGHRDDMPKSGERIERIILQADFAQAPQKCPKPSINGQRPVAGKVRAPSLNPFTKPVAKPHEWSWQGCHLFSCVTIRR